MKIFHLIDERDGAAKFIERLEYKSGESVPEFLDVLKFGEKTKNVDGFKMLRVR